MAEIDPRSRYAGLPILQVPGPDGSPRTLRAPRVVPEPPIRGTYETRAGDRLDLLAHAAAGDSTRWWLLADANPWPDPRRLEQPGQIVELPDV